MNEAERKREERRGKILLRKLNKVRAFERVPDDPLFFEAMHSRAKAVTKKINAIESNAFHAR